MKYPPRPNKNYCECGHYKWHHKYYNLLICWIFKPEDSPCKICMCSKFQQVKTTNDSITSGESSQ